VGSRDGEEDQRDDNTRDPVPADIRHQPRSRVWPRPRPRPPRASRSRRAAESPSHPSPSRRDRRARA
jgi:hypothetical protein